MLVDGRRFLIVGHRGAAARAPENTAASLTAGLAAGADQIEVDVGTTRDGRVVLLHDTTLDRTTSGRGRLRAKTWAHVRALDAGSWFSPRFAREAPIDLDDALAIVRARVPLIVEIKAASRERERGVDPEDRETVDGVLAALLRTGGVRGVTLSSAAWTLLEHAAARMQGLDLALTVGSMESRDPIAWARRVGATALHPNRKLCSASFVARARGLGLSVLAYTVNRASELTPLLEAGVDGVFTDDPAGMRRVLARSAAGPDGAGSLVLGIDQGSGGTRAVLTDLRGTVVAFREAKVSSRRARDGSIVQNAEAVAASVVRAAGPLMRGSSRRIAAAGLAVQRSSLVVWRRSDARPVTPVLSWRPGAPYAPPAPLAAREADIASLTGLTARFPYGAIRLAALCASDPDVARGLNSGRFVAGPLGAFLVARLSDAQFAGCDPSLAQRTLAWDLGRRCWSEELAEWLGTRASWWPDVAPSSGDRGSLRLGRTRVPLRALLGDVGAATRAVIDDPAGTQDGVLVLGTGGFVVAPTGRMLRRVNGLLTTVLYEDAEGPVYGVEGTVHGLAAAVVEAGRRGGWEALPVERIASRAGAAERAPNVVAAPEGTGTPDWEVTPRFEVQRGRFLPEEVVRGTIDDLARRFGTIARLLREGGALPSRFVATGGLAAAPHLTTAIGAAMDLALAIDPRPHRTAVGAALLARDGR